MQTFVPVIDSNQKPLMPTTPRRAMRWVKIGKATPFYKHGVWCVRLNQEPSDGDTQVVAVGIDPGSKREAFTVKSEAHTYLNVLSDAVGWVKDAVEVRRNIRRNRRQRKTPYRQCRWNRSIGGIPPSTKARWQAKLRIVNILRKLYPITVYIVEDIKAVTKSQRKWDKCFSPLQVGKQWLYGELQKLGRTDLVQGYETYESRQKYGLKKTKSKMNESFDAHNVDSWVLANDYVGGHITPDNKQILRMVPIQFHRRQLHYFQCEKGGKRKRYGGTISLGLKKGSLVKNKKYGICYVGGNWKGRLSLHDRKDGKRITQSAKVEETNFLSYNTWRTTFFHGTTSVVSCR